RGDIEVEMRFDPELWPVEIDPGEMELAIVNVCVNARDAMPNAGRIVLSGENVFESPIDDIPREFVKLCVADNGSGMPPEVMARAFDPFFTTKDVGKGSGLGLEQVYGFAQQSGGRVSLTSQEGAGTVVTMLLPRSMRSPAIPPRKVEVSEPPTTSG